MSEKSDKRQSAAIFVTKLGAAERQLNAALRMSLHNEDELAIHTVAAAAYRILRDIKKKRGADEVLAPLLRGVFAIAQDLSTGKLKAVPSDVAASPEFLAVVQALRGDIANGKVKNWTDIKVTYSEPESAFWARYNKPANFLKHADDDHDAMLDQSSVRNEELLFRSSGAFVELANRATPEMVAYATYKLGDYPEMSTPMLTEDLQRKFAKLSPEKRRVACLKWLEAIKR